MRKLTKIEKKAALAVVGMTIAVAGTGIRLIRRHTRYVMEKAAAFFKNEEEEQAKADAEETADMPEQALPKCFEKTDRKEA